MVLLLPVKASSRQAARCRRTFSPAGPAAVECGLGRRPLKNFESSGSDVALEVDLVGKHANDFDKRMLWRECSACHSSQPDRGGKSIRGADMPGSVFCTAVRSTTFGARDKSPPGTGQMHRDLVIDARSEGIANSQGPGRFESQSEELVARRVCGRGGIPPRRGKGRCRRAPGNVRLERIFGPLPDGSSGL